MLVDKSFVTNTARYMATLYFSLQNANRSGQGGSMDQVLFRGFFDEARQTDVVPILECHVGMPCKMYRRQCRPRAVVCTC